MDDGSATGFEVPPELVLPAEFAGEPPRALPESAERGPLAESVRRTFWACLMGAAVCFVLSAVPWMDTLALYVLPLGYLRWIGIGLTALAIAGYFRKGEFRKAARYVREGEAAFGRVVELVKYPSVVVNGSATNYAFQATVVVISPETDTPVGVEMKSRDFRADLKDGVSTRFRVGDWVPVVWLPGKFEETAQIYDFLELTPEASLVRDSSAAKMPLWQMLAVVMAVPLFFFVLFWNIYAHGRFEPLDFDYMDAGRAPLAIGGTLGLALAALIWLSTRRKRRAVDEKNNASVATGEAIELHYQPGAIRWYGLAALIVAGSILLGGLTFLCWCFTANALLDDSPRTPLPVEITEMIQVTHSFLFREYKMKYRRAGQKKDDSLLTTPDHLDEFAAPAGLAQVRAGWLGWPWVETVDPLVVVAPVGGDGDDDGGDSENE